MDLRPSILDDDGRRVPVVRFNTTPFPVSMGPLPREVQKLLLSEVGRGQLPQSGRGVWSWVLVGMISCTPAVLCFLPFWIAMSVRPRLVASVWTYGATLAMVPLSWLVMWLAGPYLLSGAQRQAAARGAAKSGYCGSCGYPLGGGEGAVRCPECGAAWRREP